MKSSPEFLVFIFFPASSIEICRTRKCVETSMLFVKSMDDSVNPCEDFHKFACGNWISDTATVAAVSFYDHTTIMRDRTLGRLRSNLTQYNLSRKFEFCRVFPNPVCNDDRFDGKHKHGRHSSTPPTQVHLRFLR